MNPEQQLILTLARRLPARLTQDQVSYLLGVRIHDIPILQAAGLLHPLGRPGPSAPKFFAASEIEQLHSDRKFLDKASRAIQAHWARKRRRNRQQPDGDPLGIGKVVNTLS